VTVYVSLPLTGPRAAEGRDAADGARLALEQAGGTAGGLEVKAEYLDDAREQPWDPGAVGENARTASQDSSTAAYIGELDSQPTRASLPITNDAGIAQISPGAGAVDLTRPAEGYPESPERYQPSGDPKFARVIPDDASLASAAATLASDLGLARVGVDPGKTPHETLSASEFERAAGEVGVEVTGPDAAEVDFEPLEDGSMRLAPDGLVAAALDPADLPGRAFVDEFRASFGREPGAYAAYGFEAMALALQAIGEADRSEEDYRGAIVDALLDAERPDSVLGRYSITDDGDTTLCAIQPHELNGKEPVALKPICPSG
jgi:branched-chain amino acid transport system substrate-binding protein